jgi:hypothetical protein
VSRTSHINVTEHLAQQSVGLLAQHTVNSPNIWSGASPNRRPGLQPNIYGPCGGSRHQTRAPIATAVCRCSHRARPSTGTEASVGNLPLL